MVLLRMVLLLVLLSTMMYIGCERSTCELMVLASSESFLLNLPFALEIFFFFFFFFGDFSLDLGRLDSRDRGRLDSRDLGRPDSRDLGRLDSRDPGRMVSRDFGREDSLDGGRVDSLDGGLPLDCGRLPPPLEPGLLLDELGLEPPRVLCRDPGLDPALDPALDPPRELVHPSSCSSSLPSSSYLSGTRRTRIHSPSLPSSSSTNMQRREISSHKDGSSLSLFCCPLLSEETSGSNPR